MNTPATPKIKKTAVSDGNNGYNILDADGKQVGTLKRSESQPHIWHLRDENNQLVDYDRYQNNILERREIRKILDVP